MQETLVLLLYNENSYVKGLKKEGRRGRRIRSVVVVPLDLSIYVVDIAGKLCILANILKIHRFQIPVKRSIKRKASTLPIYYISMPRSVRLEARRRHATAPKHARITRRAISHLQLLRKLIDDVDGFVRGQDARIIHQLIKMLPDLIQQL